MFSVQHHPEASPGPHDDYLFGAALSRRCEAEGVRVRVSQQILPLPLPLTNTLKTGRQ